MLACDERVSTVSARCRCSRFVRQNHHATGSINNWLNDQMMRLVTKSVVAHASPSMLVVLGDLIHHNYLNNADFDDIARRYNATFVDHHTVRSSGAMRRWPD